MNLSCRVIVIPSEVKHTATNSASEQYRPNACLARSSGRANLIYRVERAINTNSCKRAYSTLACIDRGGGYQGARKTGSRGSRGDERRRTQMAKAVDDEESTDRQIREFFNDAASVGDMTCWS